MTTFEIIILGFLYIFCYTFSTITLIEAGCSKIDRFMLFLSMLVLSPLVTTVIVGVYVAVVIHNYIHNE